jgi:cell division protein ZapA
MAHVTVTINAKNYNLACDDGEEGHLTELAREIDRRVAQLKNDLKQGDETRLLLMAGLTVADDLVLANERIQELEEDLAGLKNEFLGPESPHATARANASADEEKLANLLESAARRMEDIAARLG